MFDVCCGQPRAEGQPFVVPAWQLARDQCILSCPLLPTVTHRTHTPHPTVTTVPQVAGVQYILDTVVQALAANPNRKFVFSDMVRRVG